MAAGTDATTATAERELVITRVLDAPRSLVFKVWTDPVHLARWWGPRDFTLPSCELDLRPGGTFRLLMRSPEDTLHRLHGVYREIKEPDRLSFTWAWVDEDGNPGHETLVTVTFAEQDGRTLLTLRQAEFESDTARDAHEGGWTQCLDRLAAYVPLASTA